MLEGMVPEGMVPRGGCYVLAGNILLGNQGVMYPSIISFIHSLLIADIINTHAPVST